MNEKQTSSVGFSELKTVPGVSAGTTYVVVAENSDILVAIKPEAQIVPFDPVRRFFQIGFRIHIRPQEGKGLPIKESVQESLNIGYLATRSDSPARYVGQVRIPVCGFTQSAWVLNEAIIKDNLIGKLVKGLYERITASGLTVLVPEDALVTMATERFLDMIPDVGKVPMPECKVYFGKESYYPPEGDGPPKVPGGTANAMIDDTAQGADDSGGDGDGSDEGDGTDN